MRSIVRRCGTGMVALAAAATVAPEGVAGGAPTLKSPSPRAACVAQAWVPSNTSDPGFLGPFISEFARTEQWGAVIRQQGCKP